jgi:2-succinyl-6-hydroxy-2,4-cyclohexadiene-1-carboxylate synthase
LSVCKTKDININYRIFRKGTPLVLIHGFSSSWEMWLPLIKDLPDKYQVIVYDIRGHGLSTAPSGEENYSLDILVNDLHDLLGYLGVKEAVVGGLSLGGAIALGFAYRYPEFVKELLIFDIHGGFQPVPDKNTEVEMSRIQTEDEEYAKERGMADLARLRLEEKRVFAPILQSETSREEYIERMARFSINGLIGIGRSKPWEAEWQRKAADSINVPTLIIVGSSDIIKSGVRILHEHIKGSRYVEIQGAYHGTARWCPEAFSSSVIDFLKTVECGLPAAGEMLIDQGGNIISK